MRRYKWFVLAAAVILALAGGAYTRASPDPSVEPFLKEMYALRAGALVTGERQAGLERFYDQTSQTGRFAYTHEEGRITYMQAWAKARTLTITQAETLLTNLRIKTAGSTATVSLIARTRLGYTYGEGEPLNQMGIGSWHWLQLARSGEGQGQGQGWKVQKEFYLDALGSEWADPYVPKESSAPSPPSGEESAAADVIPASRGRLDRAGAARYAEQFCGAAWGCGNNSDYNQRYRSYRNLGGDCANFASQTLVEGGKLKPDWIWRYDKAGSACWLNAQAFARYLVTSGRASLLARGTYPKVAGALSRLQPGDIVAYQAHGSVTHVSVVTGKDSAGVPVVAAHTADRFRNPWDLGWDRETVFWLIHLRD